MSKQQTPPPPPKKPERPSTMFFKNSKDKPEKKGQVTLGVGTERCDLNVWHFTVAPIQKQRYPKRR